MRASFDSGAVGSVTYALISSVMYGGRAHPQPLHALNAALVLWVLAGGWSDVGRLPYVKALAHGGG